MNILHVTTSDPAGAAIRQATAINRHTSHKARVVVTRDLGYGWPVDILIGEPPDLEAFKAHCQAADIIVLHKPVELEHFGHILAPTLEFGKGKKFIIYHHGENSLRNNAVMVKDFEKDIPGQRIVVTPDLLRFLPSAIYFPNMVMVDEIPPEVNKSRGTVPLVTQCATGNWEKDTEYIATELRDKCPPHIWQVISGLKYQDCMEKKRLSDIGVDHLQGYYGLSGLEYCAMAIPCLCGIDGFNGAHIREFFGTDSTPFCVVGKQDFTPRIARLLIDEDARLLEGQRARKFMFQHWHEAKLAERICGIYENA